MRILLDSSGTLRTGLKATLLLFSAFASTHLTNVRADASMASRMAVCTDEGACAGIDQPEMFAGRCDIDVVEMQHATSLSPQAFFENYAVPQRPVLLRGLATDWKARRVWTVSWLLKTIGSSQVKVSDPRLVSKFGPQEMDAQIFRDYLSEIAKEGHQGSQYMFDQEILHSITELRRGWSPPAIFQSEKVMGKVPVYQLAVGGRGRGLPWHGHQATWNAQVKGQKLWMMQPPHFMYNATVDLHEKPWLCQQKPGDVLYLPDFWKHATVAQDRFNVGIIGRKMNITCCSTDNLKQFQDSEWEAMQHSKQLWGYDGELVQPVAVLS